MDQTMRMANGEPHRIDVVMYTVYSILKWTGHKSASNILLKIFFVGHYRMLLFIIHAERRTCMRMSSMEGEWMRKKKKGKTANRP